MTCEAEVWRSPYCINLFYVLPLGDDLDLTELTDMFQREGFYPSKQFFDGPRCPYFASAILGCISLGNESCVLSPWHQP